MWVKSTEAETIKAKADAKRARLRRSIIAGLLCWLLGAFVHGKSWRIRYGSPFVSLDEIPLRLVISLPFGVFLGCLVYRFQSKRRIMICPSCEFTKNDDSIMTCTCGGHFEYLDTMKWI
jgi:hypothetical protein